MAFDLPFVTNAQRRAANLRPQTEEELDPWGATTVPRAPRVWEPDIPTQQPGSSNVAYDAWLRQHRAENQPIIPAQSPVISADTGMPQIGPGGVIRHTGLRGQPRKEPLPSPADSFLTTPEPFTPLGRTEVAERFAAPGGAPAYQEAGTMPPETEQALIAAGLIEAPAPTVRTNEYPWIAKENRWEAPPLDEITDPGFEEYTRDQWVEYPNVIDSEGNQTAKMMPKPLAQLIARRGGFGTQPSTRADFFDGLDWAAKPFEVLAETVTEAFGQLPTLLRGNFGDLDAPTLFTEGFVASYEEFRDRPMWQQIVLGIVTDPVVMLKAFTMGAKLLRAGVGVAGRAEFIPILDLFRAQVAYAARESGLNLSDDAADEIARSLASKMDEVIAATPAAKRLSPVPWVTEEGSAARWQEFLGRGEEMGRFAVTSLSEKRAQWKLLRDEYKLALDSGANEFAPPLRGIASVIDEVVTHEASGFLGKAALKVVGAVVGPSITRSTPVGKITTAYGRQVRSGNELVKVAMASAYDRHIDQFDELKPIKDRVIPVNSKGEWVDSRTGKVVAPWQIVFEHPDQYSQFVTPKARKLIDDVNRMTNDEVTTLLDDEGIVQHIRDRAAGEYYVPHHVKEIRGVDVSDIGLKSNLGRHYDEVTDGMARGIKYGTNPRQDIELYMKWAYRKVAKKQLDDALEEHGMTRSQLVPKDIHDAAVGAAVNYSNLVKQSKKLAGQIRIATGVDKTLGRGVSEQERTETKLNAELVRLRGLLDDLPDLVGVGETPGRQELIASQSNLNQAIKLQRVTETAVRNARAAVATSKGKLGARTDEARRLDANYDRLVSARDDMVQASHAYTGDQPSILASGIRQQDLTQRQFRTLGVEETRARRAADAAAGRVESVSERRDELAKLADLVDEDLQVARELTSEAQARLRYATSQAGVEQAQRGAIKGKAATWNREVTRLQNRLNRLLDPEKGRLGRLRDKQSAQRAVLEFLSAQQDNLKTAQADALKEAQRTKSVRRVYINKLKDEHVIDGALWGPNQPTSIRVDQWHNRYFTPEDARLLKEVITGTERPGWFNKWVTRPVVSLVNVKRSLVATLDAAEPFIQGLPVLASNPKAWAVQTSAHYQALLDPAVQSRRIHKNITDYQWLARHGVPIGDLEFFAALETGEGVSFAPIFRILPKGEEVQRYFRTAGKQSFGRFGAMYNTGLGEARVQLLQSIRVGWKGTDAELAQHIRNLTGGLDASALGLGPGRTAAEGFWVAFSPRLLRATVALVGDAFQGVPLELVPKALEPVSPRLSRGIRKTVLRGKEAPPVYGVDIDLAGGVTQDVQREIVGGYASTAQGRRALRTLATLASGVTMTYIVTGMALGKDWDEIKEGLNPLNGKRFLSHQINGDWIGVGGQVRAIAQLVSASAVGAYRIATTGDLPTRSEIFSRRDNPLLRFLSGRGALGTQAVLQAGEAGAAAMGGQLDLDPFERIDSWTDLGKVQGKGTLPFVLQGMLEGEKWPTSIASALGMRASEWTEYDGMRDNKGVRTEQLQHFVQANNVSLGEKIEVEWEGEALEFNLPEEIVEFGDLQPREQALFKALYPSTFVKEEELTRALAEDRNAPDWAIERVKAWDREDGMVKEQETSDAAMLDGTLGVEKWKENYQENMFKLMVERKITYDYDKDEMDSPLDIYYAKMEEIQTVTHPTTKVETQAPMTDERWQELQVWLQGQKESFQVYVDKNTGLSAPTAETQEFKNAKNVLADRYWGPADDALNFPEEHSRNNIRIWSDSGVEFFDVSALEARVYKEGENLTDRMRVDWMTPMFDERGTKMEKIKDNRRFIYNKVGSQLRLLKKQIRTDDDEVREYSWKYYATGTSAEARFIQDFMKRGVVGAAP